MFSVTGRTRRDFPANVKKSKGKADVRADTPPSITAADG